MLYQAVERGRAEMYYPTSVALLELEPYMNDPHDELFEAIRSGAGDQAATIMADHITETWRAVSLYIASGDTYRPSRVE